MFRLCGSSFVSPRLPSRWPSSGLALVLHGRRETGLLQAPFPTCACWDGAHQACLQCPEMVTTVAGIPLPFVGPKAPEGGGVFGFQPQDPAQGCRGVHAIHASTPSWRAQEEKQRGVLHKQLYKDAVIRVDQTRTQMSKYMQLMEPPEVKRRVVTQLYWARRAKFRRRFKVYFGQRSELLRQYNGLRARYGELSRCGWGWVQAGCPCSHSSDVPRMRTMPSDTVQAVGAQSWGHGQAPTAEACSNMLPLDVWACWWGF